VFQGELEDCALLARMIGLAAHRPEALERAIVELPDGRFEVTLVAAPSQPVQVIVDRLVPFRSGSPDGAGPAPMDRYQPGARAKAVAEAHPVWPAVLEKAVATLHGGYLGVDGESFEERASLDGSQEFTIWVPKAGAKATEAAIVEAIAKGATVELGNGDPALTQAAGLRPAHAYALISLSELDGTPAFRLQNPTGEASPHAVPGHASQFDLTRAEALRIFRFVGIAAPDLHALHSLAALPTKPPAIEAAEIKAPRPAASAQPR